MTRGARIHRLHSRDKTRRNFGENHAERADLSSCTLSAPKNANDGAGARMMIFSEGARARCAPPLLLLRLYGGGVEDKKEPICSLPSEDPRHICYEGLRDCAPGRAKLDYTHLSKDPQAARGARCKKRVRTRMMPRPNVRPKQIGRILTNQKKN